MSKIFEVLKDEDSSYKTSALLIFIFLCCIFCPVASFINTGRVEGCTLVPFILLVLNPAVCLIALLFSK